ncbi:hypothetical protein GGR58DRAFT_456250 [Xylaria digitata]|nr:hypothetical protein GGR58DRAFT_456250 [Xylaria digitata]
MLRILDPRPPTYILVVTNTFRIANEVFWFGGFSLCDLLGLIDCPFSHLHSSEGDSKFT